MCTDEEYTAGRPFSYTLTSSLGNPIWISRGLLASAALSITFLSSFFSFDMLSLEVVVVAFTLMAVIASASAMIFVLFSIFAFIVMVKRFIVAVIFLSLLLLG